MGSLVTAVAIAVLASVVVVVLAAAASPESDGVRAFFRDLRGGLVARFGRDRAAGRPEEDVEPVDTTLDDFFAATATDETPYFAADGLASRLENVVDATRSRSRN